MKSQKTKREVILKINRRREKRLPSKEQYGDSKQFSQKRYSFRKVEEGSDVIFLVCLKEIISNLEFWPSGISFKNKGDHDNYM